MQATEYVWNEANRAIHLSLDVVSRLSLEAMEAFKAVPRRGLEIGGLLLGDIQPGSIYIRDFEPVESEHRAGPSYKLSETDTRHFEEALSRHPDAVGIYRTQTRDDSLSLQEDDANFFRNHFTVPGRVFMLVHPATREAAFFLPNDTGLDPVHVFPFHPSELQNEPNSAPPRVPANLPIARPASRSVVRWIIPVAAVLCGMGAGALLYGYLHPVQNAPVLADGTKPISAADAQAAQPGHVALKVQRDGSSIRLYWDRNSSVIRNAAKAILYISDGEHQSQLNLDPSELNSGLVSYWPESKDVTFRLEVFAAGHSTDDSIRVVGGSPVPVTATTHRSSAPPLAERAAAPPPQPAPATGFASRSEEPAPEVRPSPFTPPAATPAPEATTSTSAAAPPPRPIPHETRPEVSVVAEPVGASRFGSAIGKIPLLRRLRKQRQSFVPPAPAHEFRPVLSAAEKRTLDRPIVMDVRVWVGENGKVQYAELASNSGRHRDLAAAAVYAARRWDFTPARVGEERVPGEVILHFKFSPEAPPDATP